MLEKVTGSSGQEHMLKKLKNAEKVNRRKSVRWSAEPVPYLSRLCLKLRESRAAAPKGSMTYAFTQMGNFLVFWPLG